MNLQRVVIMTQSVGVILRKMHYSMWVPHKATPSAVRLKENRTDARNSPEDEPENS